MSLRPHADSSLVSLCEGAVCLFGAPSFFFCVAAAMAASSFKALYSLNKFALPHAANAAAANGRPSVLRYRSSLFFCCSSPLALPALQLLLLPLVAAAPERYTISSLLFCSPRKATVLLLEKQQSSFLHVLTSHFAATTPSPLVLLRPLLFSFMCCPCCWWFLQLPLLPRCLLKFIAHITHAAAVLAAAADAASELLLLLLFLFFVKPLLQHSLLLPPLLPLMKRSGNEETRVVNFQCR